MQVDLVNIVARHPIQALAAGVCISSILVLIKRYLKRSELVQRYQKLKIKKILTLGQALQKSKTQRNLPKQSLKNSNQQFLIKIQAIPQKGKFIYSQQITSNQVYYIQPSLNKIGDKITQLLNGIFKNKTPKAINKLQKQLNNKPDLTWLAKDENRLKKIKINGFGQIIDSQIFQISTKYTISQKIGLFKKVWKAISYFFQAFFFVKYQNQDHIQKYNLSRNQFRSPVIKGPVIGKIDYIFNFIENRHFLIEAKIEDGVITPILMSTSKFKMLEYFESHILDLNISMSIQIFLFIASFRYIYPSIKVWVRRLMKKIKSNRRIQRLKNNELVEILNINSELLSQDKLCIICYTNCRNTILFDCRHMIMCQNCKQVYGQNVCPLCKVDIENFKHVYQKC